MTAILDRTAGERLALGRVANQAKSAPTSTYVLFPDRQLQKRNKFFCATPDSGVPYTAKELASPGKNAGGCVDVFFEIDYDIYLDKGGINAAAQHLAANFNEVSVLYAAIDVDLKISEILVWDRTSPYGGTSSSALLTQFQSTRTSFNGDLAQLVSYQASGGIAVLNGLCHPFNSARMSFSSIRPTFAAVPTYSWSTMVIAHELGHLLGSQHTHACVWNGDNTAIDGCPGWTEGNCATPSLPVGGGTIMSYCHLRPVGINFLRGFGPQPSAVIQSRVAAAQDCVQAVCDTDDDNDGNDGDDNDEEDDDNPPAAACAEQTVYVNLVLDDFGMETTWRLRSEGGALVASGGPYPKKQKGRRVSDTVCVVDGCYIFEIRDSDYDGICCEYGNGSYELRDSSGNVLGGGGGFDTLDIVDFCLPELPP
ncbi:MAG: M12 family metallo-peptidase, partial [Bacteroidota bacterium]